jgi:hypothetical protein
MIPVSLLGTCRAHAAGCSCAPNDAKPPVGVDDSSTTIDVVDWIDLGACRYVTHELHSLLRLRTRKVSVPDDS